MEKLTDLREALSNLEHEQWMHWSQTVGERINFWKRTLSEENKKINVVKLDEIEFRMHAQLDGWEPNWVPYIELPEDVKDFDRVWADKVLTEFASFLEKARKELKEKICDRTHEIFTGKCSTLSPDSGWTCQNCIDVNAVLGEEEGK